MDHLHFVFAIFFMLLGPIKILPVFLKLTKDHDQPFRAKTAALATAFAAGICGFLILTSQNTLAKYHIRQESLMLAGGLVLLISALRTIFPVSHEADQPNRPQTPLSLAVSPLATPVIITPAGIAAVMLFVSMEARDPSYYDAIRIALVIVLALDFLVMYFASVIARQHWIMPLIWLAGSVMIVVQVAGAMDLIVKALKSLGLFPN